jgi:hypothetical protein
VDMSDGIVVGTVVVDYTCSLNMLQFRIKSFDVWKAKYAYVMSLSLTAYVPALLDIIITLLYPGQYVIKDTSLSFSLNVYCLLRD